MRAGLAHGGQHALPFGLLQRQARHHVEQPLPAQRARLGAADITGPGRRCVQPGQLGHLAIAVTQPVLQPLQRLGAGRDVILDRFHERAPVVPGV